MAEKSILQTFEDFRGLDLKSTDLTRQPTSFKQLSNTRFGEGRSIRKREGYQCIGSAGGFTKIFTYSYSDPDTGASTEELLAVNSFLWKLKASALTVTGGTNVNYSVAFNFSSSTFRMVIRNGTTAVTFSGNSYIDLGTGLESDALGNGIVDIEDLRATIDGDASLACAQPSVGFARVNGNQSNVTAITVLNSPHTYVVGDWLTFFDYKSNQLVARLVTAVTTTQITFDSNIWDSVDVKDGQTLGPLGTPAGTIYGKDVSTGTASSMTIPFYYWDLALPTTHHYYMTTPEPLRENYADRGTTSTYNYPCLVNANKNAYAYARAIIESPTASDVMKPYTDYPFKYDGQNFYREGLPQPTAPTASGTSTGLTGTYKYRIAYVQIDNRGNEIIGRASDETSITLTNQKSALTLNHFIHDTDSDARTATVNGNQNGVTAITVSAGHNLKALDWVILYDRNPTPDAVIVRQVASVTTTSVTIAGAVVDVGTGDIIYTAKHLGFNTKGAVVNGAQTDTKVITVHDSTGRPNGIYVGDTLYFLDTRPSTPVYTSRKVTARTATTLTFTEGASVNVTDALVMTCNLRIRIYRTKAGGNIYYELVDIPLDYTNLTTSYTDGAADTTLVVRFLEPEIGFEADLPPKASIAVSHQGTRVASGIKGEPNTVAVYDVLNPEGVSLASQYFDISSNVTGEITALSSDTIGSLAVFKPNAYYAVNGDLAAGSVEVVPVTEGDYGISSQSSVSKIKGVTFGVGAMGFFAIQNGSPIYGIGSLVNSALQNNPNLYLSKAMAVNDWSNRGYHVFVPSTTALTDDAGIGSYESFFYDYENDIWFDDDFSAGVEPTGGMTMYQNTEFILSRAFGTSSTSAKLPGHVFRGLKLTSSMATAANLYLDNTLAITRYIRFIITLGTPSIDKEFLRLKIFSLYNPGESNLFVSATIGVNTYKNFQSSTVSSTLSLSYLSTDFENGSKLVSTKARAMEFVIDDNSVQSCFHMTGWELLVALPYREEDIRR